MPNQTTRASTAEGELGTARCVRKVNKGSSSSTTDITVILQSSPGCVTPAITVTSPGRGLVWPEAIKVDQDGVSDSECQFLNLSVKEARL